MSENDFEAELDSMIVDLENLAEQAPVATYRDAMSAPIHKLKVLLEDVSRHVESEITA